MIHARALWVLIHAALFCKNYLGSRENPNAQHISVNKSRSSQCVTKNTFCYTINKNNGASLTGRPTSSDVTNCYNLLSYIWLQLQKQKGPRRGLCLAESETIVAGS